MWSMDNKVQMFSFVTTHQIVFSSSGAMFYSQEQRLKVFLFPQNVRILAILTPWIDFYLNMMWNIFLNTYFQSLYILWCGVY